MMLLALSGARADAPVPDSTAASGAAADSVRSSPADSASAGASANAPQARRPRRLLHDAGHAFVVFASDAGYVLSFPARLDAKGAVILAGTVAGEAVVYNNDEDLYTALTRNRGNSAYDRVRDLGKRLEPIGITQHTQPIYLGTLVVGYAFRLDRLQEISGELLESHLIAGTLRQLCIGLIGRKRPSQELGPRTFEPRHGRSFYSGHTSAGFEIATILSHHVDFVPFTVLAYATAATIPIQRIDARSHWASDCFLPAITGTLIARGIIHRFEERKQAQPSSSWMPEISPWIPASSGADGAIGIKLTRRF